MNIVSYARVSTGSQEYGITTQQYEIMKLVESGGHSLVGSFQERASGRKNNRPELEKAIVLGFTVNY